MALFEYITDDISLVATSLQVNFSELRVYNYPLSV